MWFSAEMTLRMRVTTDGLRYPPGFRCIRMELHIVLDDGIGLVRLAEKPAGSVLDFMNGVRNLVPDDRRQVVEPHGTAALLDRSV